MASKCPDSFDHKIKWPETEKGYLLALQCPFRFCNDCSLDDKLRQVTRQCNDSSIWEPVNFTVCHNIIEFHMDCIDTPCSPCPLPMFRELVQSVTVTLSLFSIICLMVSLVIFYSFKSLNCCRLTIHKHLCTVFMFRFLIMVTWILLWKNRVFLGCGHFSKETLEPVCKILLFCIMYTTMASINWMFIEGVYLASRISIFAFNTGTPMAAFVFIGWGIPFLWVFSWAVLMENSSDSTRNCWLPYSNSSHKWLLIIPMLVTLIVNLLLLVLIVAILVRKLTAANVEEPKKLW